ncbi:hypothetical protein [Flavobacterium sp. AG291]|uniref:hypothetical protein n=1 Tax=Flavobacterium sp. AG291 TaxID=2184000 RepID=UPI000E2D88BC|nr:hypothetical protein [Flavobacterium sp. AG291]RDI11271.1 hypothetical protein DEU42_106205 [Flavobacterium sp. AG291]
MDYATNNSGAVTAAPKQKAKAAAQKHSRVPDRLAAQERHRRGACRPPDFSPCGAAAYGFLKTRFLPHHTGQGITDSREKEHFYYSYGLLCKHYSINPVDTTGFAYPYGREVALHEAARLLNEKYSQHIGLELLEDNGNFVVEATETCYTGRTLFYIPVLPLHYMMQDKKHRKGARLLLCVFSYLFHTVNIPYYTEDSFLYWHYEMVSEWVQNDPDDWEQKDYYDYVSQLRAAQHYGETMLRRIWNTLHFDHFGEWLTAFKPIDDLDKECHRIAQKFYQLWQYYPETSIYEHADKNCLPDYENDDFDDDECITMEKYVGFVASTDGWLYENVQQSVNGFFSESLSKQEPVLKRFFDGQPQDNDTLDFECRLFPLLNELCYLLNNYDYDTKRPTIPA